MKALGLLLLMVAVIEVSADDRALGRLFFSPAERAAFDAVRHGDQTPLPDEVVVEQTEIVEPTGKVVDVLRPTITLDGYVRRANGRATLWINGENNYDGNLSASRVDAGRTVLRGDVVRVMPAGGKTSLKLKPGQSYDPNTATIRDAYEVPLIADELNEP